MLKKNTSFGLSVLLITCISQPAVQADPCAFTPSQGVAIYRQDAPGVQPSPVVSCQQLKEPPVVTAKGGALKARIEMLSAGATKATTGQKLATSIRYGEMDLYSSTVNSSKSGTSPAPILAYGYQVSAYGKLHAAQFPAPTLKLKPGQELDLEITDSLSTQFSEHDNHMPASSDAFETNFHGHGLHVNPLGMGDNVYPMINDPAAPGVPKTMRVRIPIPKDQESGVNWYHPHKHTQTHPQVYGGLAGFLVVGDPMDPWPSYKPTGSHPLRQRLMALSVVNVERGNPDGSANPGGDYHLFDFTGGSTLPANCGPGTPALTCSWQKRINGQLNPVIDFKPGETQVWTLGSFGPFGSFNIALTDSNLNNAWNSTIIANDGNESDSSKTQEIDIKPLTLKLSADVKRMQDQSAPTLIQGGNRLTLAVTAPDKPGTYYLIDGWGNCNSATSMPTGCAGASAGSTNPLPQSYVVLATIVVAGEKSKVASPDFSIKNASYALFNEPPDVRSSTYFQSATYPSGPFLINWEPFGLGDMKQLQIGTIEEWELVNVRPPRPGSFFNSANHPFHIHQGNFIVTEVNHVPIDPYAPPDQLVTSANYVSPRDTVNLPLPLDPTSSSFGYSQIKIKFKVEDFPGKYVLHCHILNHEDNGMMSPLLAYGPVEGLRGVFGSHISSQASNVNVINGAGELLESDYPFGKKYTGGLSTASALGAAKFYETYAVGMAHGGTSIVVYDGPRRREIARFKAFSDTRPNDGVSVALGDINGDGQPDVVVGRKGEGPAELRIFSSRGTLMRKFSGFMNGVYPHGINVALGDVNADNFDDIVVGAGDGSAPVVTVFSGRELAERQKKLFQLFSFPAKGDDLSGVRVAVGYVAPNTKPSYLANIVTTPETAGVHAGEVSIWNTCGPLSACLPAPTNSQSKQPPEGSTGSTSDLQACLDPSVTPSGPAVELYTFQAFTGSNEPVQIQTGYYGAGKSKPTVFAWRSPTEITSTSIDTVRERSKFWDSKGNPVNVCPIYELKTSSFVL